MLSMSSKDGPISCLIDIPTLPQGTRLFSFIALCYGSIHDCRKKLGQLVLEHYRHVDQCWATRTRLAVSYLKHGRQNGMLYCEPPPFIETSYLLFIQQTSSGHVQSLDQGPVENEWPSGAVYYNDSASPCPLRHSEPTSYYQRLMFPQSERRPEGLHAVYQLPS